jgi:hypothetical protein
MAAGNRVDLVCLSTGEASCIGTIPVRAAGSPGPVGWRTMIVAAVPAFPMTVE